MGTTVAFEHERARLRALAAHVLGDPSEAEDIVQQVWLRLARAEAETIANLPGWLTTVTTRLCLDRLKARVPVPVDDPTLTGSASPLVASGPSLAPDPAEQVALADAVGVALSHVLDRLTPAQRVAFVLHESFNVEFSTIAAILDTTPAAARKLASRARGKVRAPLANDVVAPVEVVDAFMRAARAADFGSLLALLAPEATVSADAAATALGTPARLEGPSEIATFFNGSASAALPVYLGSRPASAWFHRGAAKVIFDFEVEAGQVRSITFRADPSALGQVRRRPSVAPTADHHQPAHPTKEEFLHEDHDL